MRIVLLLSLTPGCAAVAPEAEEDAPETAADGLTFERPEVGAMYWNGASCTGTLVRDNVVLTAARCVGFGANDGRGAALGMFIVHQDAEHRHQFAFDAFVSFGVAEGAAVDDVALLRLTDRVPAELARPAPLAVRAAATDEAVTLFGFGCRGHKEKRSHFQGGTADMCGRDIGGPSFLADGSVFQINGAAAFGDVVRHRASLEAQAEAWADGQQLDAPDQDLSCDGLLACVGGCGADVPCRQACAARTAPAPRRLYDTMIACSQANQCVDFGCVERACAGAVQACRGASAPGIETGLSCPELLGCAHQCGVDQSCAEACRDRATGAARQAFDGYAECFAANDCMDGECASIHCQEEYGACGGEVQEPEPDIVQPDPTEPEQDGEDPSEDAELPETDPGPPPESDLREPPPPELTCREVLECVERCNDPSCQQDCFLQGRVLAQIAYSALSLCGTLHLCGTPQCLQQNCAAEYETCITGRYVPPPPRDRPGDPCECP